MSNGDIPQRNPFLVLGVPAGASEEEIQEAYRRKVREHPPQTDPEGFKRVREAYEFLQDRRARLKAGILWFPEPADAPSPEEILGLGQGWSLLTPQEVREWLMEACLAGTGLAEDDPAVPAWLEEGAKG